MVISGGQEKSGEMYRNRCIDSFYSHAVYLFVCVEVLWPSQPNGLVSSAVNLPNHTFTGQT